MNEALPQLGSSPRLSLIARLVSGHLALDRGDVEAASEHARAALARWTVADLRIGAHALWSRVLLAQGHAGQAQEEAQAALALRRECRDLELTEGMAEIAAAEALQACG